MNMYFFDGHNDTVLKCTHPNEFIQGNEQSHLDLPRGQSAGMIGGFFAMFSPGKEGLPSFEQFKTDKGYRFPLASSIPLHESQQITNQLFSRLLRYERNSQGRFKIIRNKEELKSLLKAQQMGAVLHMEGADSIDADLHALHVYYEAGLRSLGLAWSRPNEFATGVPYHFPASPDIGPGLTDKGISLVKECNRLGIMIDVSHLNEKGFWDVVKHTKDPVVATHSNAHSLCPISRNLTDEQLDAIQQTNGVVGVTFSLNMLRKDGIIDPEQTPVRQVVDHILYIADRIGIDHVALGSDFDGTSIPAEMDGVDGVPSLLRSLKENGFSKKDVEKLSYRNWFRILQQTWK
ncbi:membrane dipeptidase [Halobacillus fulvus]|nr:membrane dipeptidase [Halobacillus fulvus]